MSMSYGRATMSGFGGADMSALLLFPADFAEHAEQANSARIIDWRMGLNHTRDTIRMLGGARSKARESADSREPNVAKRGTSRGKPARNLERGSLAPWLLSRLPFAEEMYMPTIGIDAIALAVPEGYLDLADLAAARGVPAGKYVEGLGVSRMSVARAHEDPVALGATAARRVLTTAGIDPSDRKSVV